MKKNFLILAGMIACAISLSWAHGPAPDCSALLKMSDKEAYARGPVLEAVRNECAKVSSEESKKHEETTGGNTTMEENNIASDNVQAQ